MVEQIVKKTKEKRYVWIKLKTDFFSKAEIDFLLQQENGCQYIVLYQMLCLNTANNNGKMSSKVGEMLIKYDPKKIARDTKYFDVDTVIVALELYKKLGLIYEGDDKVLSISNFKDMVGSESASAPRVREHREKQIALQCNKNVIENVTLENRDKSIEYRDKSIDTNNTNSNINNNYINSIYFDNKNVNDLFIDYLNLRIKLKAVNSKRAIDSLINKLNNWDDEDKIQMINNSIVSSWKDVYPLKNKLQGKTQLEYLKEL